MALALAYLHGLTPDARGAYDRRMVLSANVSRDGDLLRVQRFSEKVSAVSKAGLALLVSPDNWPDVQAEAEQRDPGLRTEKVEDVSAALTMMRIHPSRHPYWLAPLMALLVLVPLSLWAVAQAKASRDAQRSRELTAIVARDARSDPGRAAVAALAVQRLTPGEPEARNALTRVAGVDPRLRSVPSSGSPADAVAMSPAGDRIALGGDGNRVRVQEPGGGPYRSARHGGAGISALAFTPDGRSLISGDDDGLVFRWDVSGPVPRPARERLLPGGVERLEVSPDGRLVAAQVAGRGVSVWPLTAGAPRGGNEPEPLPMDGITRVPVEDPTDVVFIDDDSVAVTSPRQREVEAGVYSALSGRREKSLLPANRTVFDGAHALAMGRLADGRRVLAVGRRTLSGEGGGGRVVVWDVRTWKAVRRVEDVSSVTRLASGRDGGRLVIGSSGAGRPDAPTALRILDLNTGRWLGPELGGRAMKFRGKPRFDAAGSRLVTLTDAWHATDWSVRPGPELHDGAITRLVTDPRSPGRVVSSGMDGMVRVIDVPGLGVAEAIDLQKYGPVVSLAATSDGRTAVTGHMDGRVVVSDRNAGRPVRVLGGTTPDGLGRIVSLAVDEEAGRLAAGGLDGAVRLWSLLDGRLLRETPPSGHGAARTLLFTPDGGRLIVGYDLGHAEIVPLGGGGVRTVAFTTGLVAAVPLSASTLLIGEGGGALHVTDQRLRRTGTQPSVRLDLGVQDLEVSPDGETWLAADVARTGHVIDARTGTETAVVNAAEPGRGNSPSVAPVYAAAFTGNGRYAVFASGDGRLAVLDLDPASLIRRVCSLFPAGAPTDSDFSVPAEAHMGREEALAACR